MSLTRQSGAQGSATAGVKQIPLFQISSRRQIASHWEGFERDGWFRQLGSSDKRSAVSFLAHCVQMPTTDPVSSNWKRLVLLPVCVAFRVLSCLGNEVLLE